MSRIAAVAALDRGHGIGRAGQLPWHLPADLKYFKALTLGKPVVMGRKTFESIGRPLPDRINIVVSRSGITAPGVHVAHSIPAALALARQLAPDKEVMVIGGGEIYRGALEFCDTVYLTEVNARVEADTFFPELPPEQWCLTSRKTHGADERHNFAFDFVTYQRRTEPDSCCNGG